MYNYTIDTIRRGDNGLFDLMQKTTIQSQPIAYVTYTVSQEEEMRLDLISFNIYGTTNYVEELMVVNGIMNPWTIKAGDELKIFNLNDIPLLNLTEPVKVNTDTSLSNPEKNTKKDPNRLPPTSNPGLKQVTLDTKAKKIKIISRLS